MSTDNIRFHGEIRETFFRYFLLSGAIFKVYAESKDLE